MSESPVPFSLEQRDQGDTVTLLVGGELDLAAAPELSARLKQLAHEGCRVIVDLRALEFIDSSGLSVLIRAAADARRDGWDIGIIRGGSRDVQRAIALVGLDEVLPFLGPQ